MNKKFDISNVRYELISSSHPGYKEVQVLFTHQGKEEKHFIFVKDEGKKNYVKEAKKIFKQDLKSGKVVQALKVTPGTKPWLIVSISVVAVAAIATASYFTYKYLNNPEPTPTPAVSHKFTFNGDCCMINGQYTYTHDIFEDDKNVQYTITPEEGYKLPETVTGGVSYNANTGVITISEIKEDITVTAKGIELPPQPEVTHTVHLNPNGGKLTGDDIIPNIKDGDSITKPEVTREGYNASEVEWYKTADFQEGSKFDFDKDNVRSNLFLHAKWGSITQCKVTFYEGNDGTKEVIKEVNYGEKAVYYVPTGKPGEDFLGWYTETGASYDFNTIIKDDSTKIYSKWESEPIPVTTYTINFSCSNCEIYDETGQTKIGESVDIPVSGSYTTYYKFIIKGKDDYKAPFSKSSITVKKTAGGEDVDFEYDGTICKATIPVSANLTVTTAGINKTLEEFTWAEINEISTIGRADDFFDIYDSSKPTLNCKRVQLKHQDKNGNGVIDEDEVYQTVRIIGINEDCADINNPEETKIGLTFEFADLISDEDGYSLATQWKDTNNFSPVTTTHNYQHASVRRALIKEGGVETLWAKKGETSWIFDDIYYDKSVLDMLPDDLTKVGILKSPSKYVSTFCTSGSMEGEWWEDQIINDKLFLLSPVEMGRTSHEAEEKKTTVYSYYEGHIQDGDPIRFKSQIKSAEIQQSSTTILPGASVQEYGGDIYNFAGVNRFLSPELPTNGNFWLRSPSIDEDHVPSAAVDAWISGAGSFSSNGRIYQYAFPIAPAFCI